MWPRLIAPVRAPHRDSTVVGTNAKGVFLCMKHELAAMVRRGQGGVIINTASTAGQAAMPEFSAYCASKRVRAASLCWRGGARRAATRPGAGTR